MVKKEVRTIIKSNLDILEAILKMMANTECNKVTIKCDKQRVLELRAICMLAYYHLTGVDLQERSFDDANSN